MTRHRTFNRCLLVLVGVFAMSTSAFAHATLVSSSPVNGTRYSKALSQARLVFSEPIEAGMSSAMLVGPNGLIHLAVQSDPQNINALSAVFPPLVNGAYRMDWKVMSADGHSVSGNIAFTVGVTSADLNSSAAQELSQIDTSDAEPGVSWRVLAIIARAVGMSALLAFMGIMFFASRTSEEMTPLYSQAGTLLALTAAIALLIHLVVWAIISLVSQPSDSWTAMIFQTGPGTRETFRVVLAMLALWAWALARQKSLAFAISIAAVIASAAAGHSAAIQPEISITLKAVHLVSGGIWLGGICWLTLMSRAPLTDFGKQVTKVSYAAGICLLLVLISGLAQTGVVLSWHRSSLTSAYGLTAAAKLFGLLVLAMLGAYNRYRLIPMLMHVSDVGVFKRSLRAEIAIMIIVVTLGSVLAYLAPPR